MEPAPPSPASCFCSLFLRIIKKNQAAVSACLKLTVVVGDVIRNVDLPVRCLSPLAALAGAGVGVSLPLAVDGDVSLDQSWFVAGTDWRRWYNN